MNGMTHFNWPKWKFGKLHVLLLDLELLRTLQNAGNRCNPHVSIQGKLLLSSKVQGFDKIVKNAKIEVRLRK